MAAYDINRDTNQLMGGGDFFTVSKGISLTDRTINLS